MIAKINAFLQAIAAAVLSILPNSPVRPFIDQLSSVSWLGLLNWFVPIGTMVSIGTAWLSAITIFYVYQVILRWAKVASSS